MKIRVGCGSWTDDDYVGLLYPPGAPAEERLTLYATKFNHVEVNFSAYRTPNEKMTANWVRRTPASFTFSVKLHRDFSRAPRKTAQETTRLEALLRGTQPLITNQRLTTFLLVMDPAFRPQRNQLEELDAVVEKLQPHVLAVELRNRDWVHEEAREMTLRFFRERALLSWVSVDMPRIDDPSVLPEIDDVTHPQVAYLRLHGRNAEWARLKSTSDRHTYPYDEVELKEIAQRVRALAARAETVHVIANNHASDFAPRTALGLQRFLEVNDPPER